MRPLSSTLTPILACSLALVTAACAGEGAPTAVTMLWNPGGGQLSVFPDDALTVDDPASRTGLRPAIEPTEIEELATVPETFQEIFRDLGTLDGWGLTAGIVLRFDAAIDPASLWSGDSTADLAAPIVVVAETAAGPVPWPYEARLTDEDLTVILEPMVPLPPETEVFVAVTQRLRAQSGLPLAPSDAMAAALAGDGIDAATARVAPRIAAAAETFSAIGGAAPEDIVGVTVFTTQSIVEDALAIAADIASRDIAIDPAGVTCTDEALWTFCEGTFPAVDYRGDGGFVPEIAGDVARGATWDVPFSVWLPLARPGPYGGDAYPTLIFGHGLGSGRSQGDRLAAFAAPRGMATIAISAVKHGDHPTNESESTIGRTLDFFGISTQELTFEPLLMRGHFRQSTYDKLQLVRALEGGVDLDGDGATDLDSERLSYLGVSLGGIMGPELLALAPGIDAAVLVVPGGRVSSIVSDAEQFAIIIEIMKPEGTTDGDVDRFFPVLQTILDRGDAATFAPYLLGDERPDGMTSAPHILMAMVLDDDTVPNTANRALARALGVPIVPPVRQEVGVIGTTGDAPVTGNWSDGRTAGLLQLDRIGDGNGGTEPATHSNIGDSDVGAETWFQFLDTLLTEGAPTIIDPYQ